MWNMLIHWAALVIRKEPMSWSLTNSPGCTVHKKPCTHSLPQGLLMVGTRHQDCAVSNPDHSHICSDLTMLLQKTRKVETETQSSLPCWKHSSHLFTTCSHTYAAAESANLCSPARSAGQHGQPKSKLPAHISQLEESQTDNDWPHTSSVGALATLWN